MARGRDRAHRGRDHRAEGGAVDLRGDSVRRVGGRGDPGDPRLGEGGGVLSVRPDGAGGRKRAAGPLERCQGPAGHALARADHDVGRGRAQGLATGNGCGGCRGGGVLRGGLGLGFCRKGRPDRLFGAAGMGLSALHPALRASVPDGGRDRRLPDRLRDDRADADPGGAGLSGDRGLAAAGGGGAFDPRARRQAGLCGGLVRVFRPSFGRGRGGVPPGPAVGRREHRFRRHRQLHAAVGLARGRGAPRRALGRHPQCRLPARQCLRRRGL